jgi:predicted dehydrogenase
MMRVAIIGLDGHPQQILNGVPLLPDCELVAVACADRPAADRLRNMPVAAKSSTYSEWREMLDREKPDVVGVCDVPGERAEVLIELAQRNIHIVSEKPLATTFENLHRVRDAVGRSESQLSMLLTMRFEAPYLAMRQAIQQGAIGRVVQASAQKSYKLETGRPPWQKRRQQCGGIIPFIGCHAIDLIRWTTGEEFTHVAGFSARTGLGSDWHEFEDNASLVLKMRGGGAATINLDFHRPMNTKSHGDDRVRLVGTDGIIEATNGDPVQTVEKQVVLMRKSKPPEKLPLVKPGQLFVDFVTALRSGSSPRITAQDAFAISEICLHARHAADTGSIVVL